MRKRNAKFFFVAAIFSMSCMHHVEAQKERQKTVHAGDAFQHGYVGADVGFSTGRCRVEYVMDDVLTTGSDPEKGVSPTYYNNDGVLVTPPVSLPGEVLNFQTEYTLGVGDFVGAMGDQCLLDLIVGYNAHVGHGILLGGDVVLRYTPSAISGFGYVNADILTKVIGESVASPAYTVSNVCNNVHRTVATDSRPSSFVYDTSGITQVDIYNSWNLDFLLNMGYAVSPVVSILLKAGVALGFWHVNGAVNFQSNARMFWSNHSLMTFGASPFEADHYFDYSPVPEKVQGDFSQNSTFVGLVLAPTVQVKISQSVVAFLKIELSLYGNHEMSLDADSIGVVDMTMRNVNTVSGLMGIAYTFGGK